jgi:hypothetical protein
MSGQVRAQDDGADTVAREVVIDTMHLLRFSADFSKPVLFSGSDSRRSYEFVADYYWKKELYFVMEGGWGNSTQQDSILSFSSKNTFFKAGINKSMLSRRMSNDWDMAFIGARYALGLIERGDASFVTWDPYWGTTSGIVAGKNLTAHWAEVTAGVKLELYRGIFTGWTARGKFLLNKNSFRELPPAYIAGYGKGEKNAIIDFNFYLGYAIKWQRVKGAATVPNLTPSETSGSGENSSSQ